MSDSGELQTLEAANCQPPSVRRDEDVAALYAALKLQHGPYQRFARRPAVATPPQTHHILRPHPKAGARTQVGIYSPAGGSGKSLIAAGLASIFCQREKHVLLVDASPWLTLAFYFGASEIRAGYRTFSAPGLHKTPVHLFSCGEGEEASGDAEQLFDSIAPDYVIYDLSGVSGNLLLNYLRRCERVLVPLLPDPSALRIATSVISMITSLGASAPQVNFILNNMDASAESREVQEALVHSFGDQLLPSVIFNQPEVRKAFEAGIVLPFYAPGAQASLILGDIAQALIKPERATLAPSSRWIEG